MSRCLRAAVRGSLRQSGSVARGGEGFPSSGARLDDTRRLASPHLSWPVRKAGTPTRSGDRRQAIAARIAADCVHICEIGKYAFLNRTPRAFSGVAGVVAVHRAGTSRIPAGHADPRSLATPEPIDPQCSSPHGRDCLHSLNSLCYISSLFDISPNFRCTLASVACVATGSSAKGPWQAGYIDRMLCSS